MRIHLDPVGGMSGDMFLAAILDAHPELETGLADVLSAVGLGHKVRIARLDHDNGVLTGSKAMVEEIARSGRRGSSHAGEHGGAAHTGFRDIRKRLNAADLTAGVRDRAIEIFTRLADAEGRVHGVPAEDVTFHEVGALDSIADIALAAHLIEALGARKWSIGEIPLGSGRIRTQHGILPLPAPATLLLLRGMPLVDDGIAGERVTPTGAAILSHLEPEFGGPKTQMRLLNSGVGFGSATFPELPNVLRLMEFEAIRQWHGDTVTVFEFEIDDQTPEDLAIGLEAIREQSGVLDVLVSSVTGKKNRQSQSIRILGQPNDENSILTECFRQTTTLGVRHHRCARAVLDRHETHVEGRGVKIAFRPDGPTAKVDADDLAQMRAPHASRVAEARRLEAGAVKLKPTVAPR